MSGQDTLSRSKESVACEEPGGRVQARYPDWEVPEVLPESFGQILLKELSTQQEVS